MKKIFCLLFVLMMVLSCGDRYNNKEGYFLEFLPRECTHLILIPLNKKAVSVYWAIENSSVNFSQFSILLNTMNYDVIGDQYITDSYWTTLDSPIPSLEQQIKLDYEQNAKKLRSSAPSASDAAYDNMIPIEYRITGVSRLNISAVDISLFGKAAGESLNDFFDIEKYNPQIIASAESKNLIFGFTSDELPANIDEWLSVKPLAQANMYLKPNTTMGSLPVSVRFAVEMETTEGLVLRDTTQLITITP